MPLEERKDRWNALMAVLRANSIHDWTAHFLQALANEHARYGDPRPSDRGCSSAGRRRLSWTAPGRTRLDGLAALCDLAGAVVPGAYLLTILTKS